MRVSGNSNSGLFLSSLVPHHSSSLWEALYHSSPLTDLLLGERKSFCHPKVSLSLDSSDSPDDGHFVSEKRLPTLASMFISLSRLSLKRVSGPEAVVCVSHVSTRGATRRQRQSRPLHVCMCVAVPSFPVFLDYGRRRWWWQARVGDDGTFWWKKEWKAISCLVSSAVRVLLLSVREGETAASNASPSSSSSSPFFSSRYSRVSCDCEAELFFLHFFPSLARHSG